MTLRRLWTSSPIPVRPCGEYIRFPCAKSQKTDMDNHFLVFRGTSVRFPVLEGVGRGGKVDRLVRPTDGESLLLNPESQKGNSLLHPTGGYPAVACTMQFFLYEFAAHGCRERQPDDQAQCGGGLYVASLDPLGQLKYFRYKGLGENKGISLVIDHFGEGLVMEEDGKPGLGFPSLWAFSAGDTGKG